MGSIGCSRSIKFNKGQIMGLTKYFSKDLLAINRLIKVDQDIVIQKLNETVVRICFDDDAVNSKEGNCCIDLLIRLFARFYPRIILHDCSGNNSVYIKELKALAKTINGEIEFVSEKKDSTYNIFAGNIRKKKLSKSNTFYLGSDNWIFKYSRTKKQKFGNSDNPFGSGMAACLTAANLFRDIFKDFQGIDTLDDDVNLSSYNLNFKNLANPKFKRIKFNDVVITGLGAVGNGLLWSLSKIDDLEGSLHLVDHDNFSSSNLQRYVMAIEKDIGNLKVSKAKRLLKKKKLSVKIFPAKWSEYLSQRGDWDIDCVVVSIDNAQDRIGIQSSLPKLILNAFTEGNDIGITRHRNFISESCLTCSCIPEGPKKHRINEIADNCNIPKYFDLVKDYYNLDKAVDEIIPGKNESILSIIAKANSFDIAALEQFKGKKIDEFYSDAVCGGNIFTLSNQEDKQNNIDVPMAFQSVIAGLLLGIELVKYSGGQKSYNFQRTDFYSLFRLNEKTNPVHISIPKNATGSCICGDAIYKERYREKWLKK